MAEAIDVEELVVWAFRDQQIEAVAKRLAPPVAKVSLESGLASLLMLGCRVDSSSAGAMHSAARCHEDAAVIYDAVMSLPSEAWMLVIKHGRTGTRPEWHEEGAGAWIQPLDKNGQPKRLWRDPDKQRGYLGVAPEILIGTHPTIVEEARRAYIIWWLALIDLMPLLNGSDGLTSYTALYPHSATPPWMGK